MPHPESQPDAIDCLFETILGFMLPFYLLGAGGNAETARIAILDLIDAYNGATAPELDLVGRMIGFNAAAMDNLRLSMREGLSDTKVLQYRRNAVGLGHSAEQCRKVLEAMQTKREQRSEHLPMAGQMPAPRPVPVAPSPPSAPPREMPPAQPHASTQPDASAQPDASTQPASAIIGDPAFAYDIDLMKHNARAMLAALQARAKEFGPEAPEASIAQMGLERSQAIRLGNDERSPA